MTTIEHDVATLGALYEAHGARLRQLCERRLGNTADAEDAAHETLLKLWHTLPSYDPTRPLWPWLAKIAVNVCTDLQRRQATARTRWVPPTASEAPQPDEAVVARESDRVVRDALGQLPPSAATVLFLRDVEGWDYDRIGGHLERTPGAARVAVTRARHELRSAVETLAKVRGQWPLAGVFGGIWARARRSTDRARAAVRDLGARATGWLDPSIEAVTGSSSGVIVHTVVGALVVLGGLVLPGGLLAPAEPATAAEASAAVAPPAAAIPVDHLTTAPVQAATVAPTAPHATTPADLVSPAPEAEALELEPAPVAAPTLAVDVPAPELEEDSLPTEPPTVAEPDVAVALPTAPTAETVVPPEVVVTDLGSVLDPSTVVPLP